MLAPPYHCHKAATATIISQSAFGRLLDPLHWVDILKFIFSVKLSWVDILNEDNVAPPQQVLPEALPEDRLLRRALHPRRNLPPSGDVCYDIFTRL